MAQLRGDSKVGGKPIVTLDIMDNFVDQILGVTLETKINKKEDYPIADFNIADTYNLSSKKNGFYQVINAANNDKKYNYGLLSSFSNTNARFQMYSPHHEDGNSALYFRTGWDSDVKKWERVSTKSMLDEGLSKKVDINNGTASNLTISDQLTAYDDVYIGYVNWFKTGFFIGKTVGENDSAAIAPTDTNGLWLKVGTDGVKIETNSFKFNNNSVWHEGNFNPNDYVSRTATLLSQGTDLNTIKTSGYYRCNLAANRPSKITGWSYIEVIRHDDNYVLQKIYSYDGVHIYSRTLNAGAWTSWKPLGGGLSYSQDITAGNWAINDNVYEMTITHNIGSENITSVIVTDSNKMSMFTGFQVLSPTVIKVFSATNPAGKIVINAIL